MKKLWGICIDQKLTIIKIVMKKSFMLKNKKMKRINQNVFKSNVSLPKKDTFFAHTRLYQRKWGVSFAIISRWKYKNEKVAAVRALSEIRAAPQGPPEPRLQSFGGGEKASQGPLSLSWEYIEACGAVKGGGRGTHSNGIVIQLG